MHMLKMTNKPKIPKQKSQMRKKESKQLTEPKKNQQFVMNVLIDK